MRSGVKITLVSPMFSWADAKLYKSKFSCVAPSLSGVSGLLCSYLGLERDDPKTIEIMKSFSLITKTYALGNEEIKVSEDFCTVVMPKTLNANHLSRKQILLDKASHRNTGVFPKEYIENVAYDIIFVDDGKLDEILSMNIEDIKYPAFHIYGGRKAYPFSVPVSFKRGSVEELLGSVGIPEELSPILKETRWEDSLLNLPVTKVETRIDKIDSFVNRQKTKRKEFVHVHP